MEEKSKETIELRQYLWMLIEIARQQNRAAVHVLAQGSRSPKSQLNKLPTDLLGKIAACFFSSSEDKLATKIEKFNNKKQDTYCGFKPGFLLGKRF